VTTAVHTIPFRKKTREHEDRRLRRKKGLGRKHPARVARLLALALQFEEHIKAGEFADYADIARQEGLTRARVTQVMNPTLLAPAIQAEVLALRFRPGRQPITERHLRRVLGAGDWEGQLAEWRMLQADQA